MMDEDSECMGNEVDDDELRYTEHAEVTEAEAATVDDL
jgi:hypothetical protein